MTRLQSPLDILRLNKHLHFIPGGRYDEYGNLNDWWDAETAQKFADKTQCFVEQYGSVEVRKRRERERERERGRERDRERETPIFLRIPDPGGKHPTEWPPEFRGEYR